MKVSRSTRSSTTSHNSSSRDSKTKRTAVSFLAWMLNKWRSRNPTTRTTTNGRTMSQCPRQRKLLKRSQLNLTASFKKFLNERNRSLRSTCSTSQHSPPTVNCFCRMENCTFEINKRLGHRKYRHLYRQYYRPFWARPLPRQITTSN